MAGRKPKPTYLKLLEGNPGKRPLNAAEPIPDGDLDAAPEGLTDAQAALWRHAIDNAPAGLLKKLDQSVLMVWVHAADAHRKAAEVVAHKGLIVKSPVKGEPMQNPYLAVMNKQASIMLKAAAELGFSPSARSKVQVSGGGSKQENPFARNANR